MVFSYQTYTFFAIFSPTRQLENDRLEPPQYELWFSTCYGFSLNRMNYYRIVSVFDL